MRIAVLASVLVLLVVPAVRAQPPNDTCESAVVVPDAQRNRFFDTPDLGSATADLGEPAGYCLTDPPARTVWYEWTAENDGQLLVDVRCPGGTGVSATVWDGTCSAPGSESGCGDETCPVTDALASASVSAGATYRVQVGLTGVPPTAPIVVQLCFVGPDQDDADDDGLPDCLDDCTDEDRDGFGDGPPEARPFDTCPPDNCDDVYNADQGDRDGDGVGDACDDDEPKDEKSLQEATDEGLVELSSKGCFDGDCVRIVIRAPATRGVRVRIGPGDLLLSRDEGQQDLGVTRPMVIWVPPGGTVTLGGLWTVCLELDRHGPDDGTIYDVTESFAGAPASILATGALRALFDTIAARRGWDAPGTQSAVWAITDGIQPYGEAEALLRAAGLDPAALPTDFPDLRNPNAGSSDPRSRYVTGALANALPDCLASSPAPVLVPCVVRRLERGVDELPQDAVAAKLRRQVQKRVRAAGAPATAAVTTANPRKARKLARAGVRRTGALERLLAKAVARGKLRADLAGPLLGDAQVLQGALAPLAGA